MLLHRYRFSCYFTASHLGFTQWMTNIIQYKEKGTDTILRCLSRIWVTLLPAPTHHVANWNQLSPTKANYRQQDICYRLFVISPVALYCMSDVTIIIRLIHHIHIGQGLSGNINGRHIQLGLNRIYVRVTGVVYRIPAYTDTLLTILPKTICIWQMRSWNNV